MSKDKPENHHNTNFALYTLVLTFFANIPNFLENTRDFFIGVLIIIGNFNPINIYRTISNPSLETLNQITNLEEENNSDKEETDEESNSNEADSDEEDLEDLHQETQNNEQQIASIENANTTQHNVEAENPNTIFKTSDEEPDNERHENISIIGMIINTPTVPPVISDLTNAETPSRAISSNNSLSSGGITPTREDFQNRLFSIEITPTRESFQNSLPSSEITPTIDGLQNRLSSSEITPTIDGFGNNINPSLDSSLSGDLIKQTINETE